MRDDVRRDLSDSARAFIDVVWPTVGQWCRGGRIVSTETDPSGRMFDLMAGIDAWQVCDDTGTMRGIASRVQFGAAYDSFTVRFSRASGATTEFEKRVETLLDQNAGWLFPALTIQAYIDRRGGSELQHACMTATRDLFRYILEHNGGRNMRRNPQDGNMFIVVWCKDLEAAGFRVRRWSAPGAVVS